MCVSVHMLARAHTHTHKMMAEEKKKKGEEKEEEIAIKVEVKEEAGIQGLESIFPSVYTHTPVTPTLHTTAPHPRLFTMTRRERSLYSLNKTSRVQVPQRTWTWRLS